MITRLEQEIRDGFSYEKQFKVFRETFNELLNLIENSYVSDPRVKEHELVIIYKIRRLVLGEE